MPQFAKSIIYLSLPMKRSNDNVVPSGQFRQPGYPVSPISNQTQMTFQPHVFTPVHYPRPNEMRPLNIPTHINPSPYIYNSPTNNEQSFKKMPTTIKYGQQKSQMVQLQPPKKITKPAFLNSQKQIQYSDKSSTITQDTISLRKEQSEPYLHNQGLRSTFSNITKKSQITCNKQKPSNLRVTHGFGKFGSVMMEAKKYDQEQQQKSSNKNVFSSEATTPTHRIEPAQFKSATEPKKILQKPVHKTLDQINASRTNDKPRPIIINGFVVYCQLGKGKFGQVSLARHIQTGFIVALKKIIKAKVVQYKMIQQFKRQIRLHSALDHPNIVKFYGFFEDADNIYLILEYISGGTLFDYLDQQQHLSPKQAAEFLKYTIQAISYLHQRSIAHRDIKPENIVLTNQKVAKLCDFGWSAFVESSRTTYCGTFDYAPPQILQRKNYNTAVDMWCIGVLAYELMTGRVPFQGQKRKDIMQKIISVDKTKIEYPVNIPEDARSFIQLLVQKDPSLRPKCKDLLRHPFIVNNTKKIKTGKKGLEYQN